MSNSIAVQCKLKLIIIKLANLINSVTIFEYMIFIITIKYAYATLSGN